MDPPQDHSKEVRLMLEMLTDDSAASLDCLEDV